MKDNEIYVVYQRERSERNYLGIDFGTKKPRIYMGEAKDDLWQYITESLRQVTNLIHLLIL